MATEREEIARRQAQLDAYRCRNCGGSTMRVTETLCAPCRIAEQKKGT